MPPDLATNEPREPVLSPVERVCELCFGLFMALTFVGAVSAATAGADAGRLMFYTALGCNLAWGLADAVMYLVRTLTQRARRLRLAAAIRADADPARGLRRLKAELTGVIWTLVGDAELEAVRARLAALPQLPPKPHLTGPDYVAAAGIFVLVVLGTFPVALPFLFLATPTALLVSRVLTLAMLFACGLALGRYAGGGGWKSGLAMTVVGVALTAAIIALGG
ncbi:membrane protein [Ramlibacter tataouinensis]|uniref:Membrane protein n=1 Tax=Ramlibacter tataouinensis TaxID=94132 RepID=A0A127JZK3_9BURK|nr:membrane protein [Ramlibacter tataouinensis]